MTKPEQKLQKRLRAAKAAYATTPVPGTAHPKPACTPVEPSVWLTTSTWKPTPATPLPNRGFVSTAYSDKQSTSQPPLTLELAEKPGISTIRTSLPVCQATQYGWDSNGGDQQIARLGMTFRF